VTPVELLGWDRLRHGGLLLDAPRLRRVAEFAPDVLPAYEERELRRFATAALNGSANMPDFVSFVLDKVCGFTATNGTWQRGSQIGAEWGRQAVTGEIVKPRQLWRGQNGATLPVFLDAEARLGIGRGRKSSSQTVQWLRAGSERLALLTNGRQWRLIFAGLDFDAWCEWDLDLWFEEGALSPQVHALRTLFSPKLWIPSAKDAPAPLLQAILDSRKGQAELSAVLGERVREAVELLVQGHGEVLKEQCAGVDPADIYRAAVRVVMRMVVVLFAESRELLPRDNALYHGAYGLTGLLEDLEKVAARGGNRLARSWNAWPRVLALFRLVHQGSHHPALPVPAYGGDLFALGMPDSVDGLSRALAVFESAAFDREILPDRDVHRLLERITRTKVKVRQGRASIWVPAPVDFSDLSSEYIGILYEGLLDFELKTAPAGDPVVFLAVGNQPALPLSRLEAMDDKALADLLEKMKDTSTGDDEAVDGEVADSPEEEAASSVQDGEPGEGEETAEEIDVESEDEAEPGDERHVTRTRAETWARRAVEVCKLAKKPKGAMTPEKRLFYEDAVARKARQLVVRVMLPGEWYVVRWGGTRKGSGTFYTRPGLAVPTVHRTLRPLAYTPPKAPDGTPALDAPSAAWIPKLPEEILALKVCDPGCGSGTFPVAALRFLTDALFASLHYHNRVSADGERAVVYLLAGAPANASTSEERLGQELLPCRPDDALFEPRLKAILRRHVVERCIYGVDLDPLAVELCRLALWIETMDRTLPFSFLDHKVKCGNSLLGAWFDTFQHYPAMAWKNREGGDKGHSNGVHFEKEARTKAIKEFSKSVAADLADALRGQLQLYAPPGGSIEQVHAQALETLSRLHELPVQDSAERARLYREELLGSPTYCSLKLAMDLWCACWFWPADDLNHAPLPTTLAAPADETRAIAYRLAARKRFFHWELEFPDVFCAVDSGFDAIVGNPPWDIAKPNSMEFFSNIDPLYRAYGKQVALRCQTEYFADEEIERAWLDYNAHFRAQSNAMGYAASAFGDPLENEKSQDRFAIARGRENDDLHSRWRAVRAKCSGFADPEHPFRHQGSADLNLYKAFIEQAHALLRVDGRLGFIVPSGLYSDHGTAGLRKLFLDRCKWEWLFNFINWNKIFPSIYYRFKFNAIVVQKGGTTQKLNTAFVRTQLEDWERAENLATSYARAQVQGFSPRSLAILEIQSPRDLEILEKIYANSVLLGDQGPDGWGIKYAREFDMTNDSKLFPPRPKWEADGYRPDEYSRWIKGDWRPISELWAELGVEPHPEGGRRSAQSPYDLLPIARADIASGIVLSREADAWLREEWFEDVALPLYEGRMIGPFDFSQKGWVSGKGRGAVWAQIESQRYCVRPQYLMRSAEYASRRMQYFDANEHNSSISLRDFLVAGRGSSFIDVTSSTNARTTIAAVVPMMPHGHSAPKLINPDPLSLTNVLNSLVFDWSARLRQSGLHLVWSVLEELPVVARSNINCSSIFSNAKHLSISLPCGAVEALLVANRLRGVFPRSAATPHERLRLEVINDVIMAFALDLNLSDLRWILRNCDYSSTEIRSLMRSNFDPIGFWRVDKDKDPEMRHTVLTLVAFHDLEEKIRTSGGDRDKGIAVFLSQNGGEGWMIPETLRLADYRLGHDDRANQPQPIASRLGIRFYDWQLAQSPEEIWRECHLHARNLLGKNSYLALLAEVIRDAAIDSWKAALAPAYELAEKTDLLPIFIPAFADGPVDTWRDRFKAMGAILHDRRFTVDPADLMALFFNVLKHAPQDSRSVMLAAACGLMEDKSYRELVARLEAEENFGGVSGVAQAAAGYNVGKSQGTLFE